MRHRGTYVTIGFATLALACGLVFAVGDDGADELRHFVKQKTAALEQINTILDDAQSDAQVHDKYDELSAAAKTHFEARTALWRAQRNDAQAWGDAWFELREPHDAALAAFNEHVTTPGGRLMPSSDLVELCLEMFGRASGIEYVKRDYWHNASVSEGRVLPRVDEGDELVIGLEDGVTSGLRSSAHPYRTLAFITLPLDWQLGEWIELTLDRSLHLWQTAGYLPGTTDTVEIEHARVRVIEADEKHLRIELAIVGDFFDARDEDRRRSRFDYRGPFTVHLAELPCS